MKIPLPLQAFARDYPEQDAIVCGDRVWTAAEWYRAAQAAAVTMQPGRGEVIAVGGVADLEWAAAVAGVWLCGGVVAPLAHHDPPTARSRALEMLAPDRVWEVTGGLPTPAGEGPSVHDWQHRDRFVRLLTSGSTGRPRRVDLRFGQCLAGALGSIVRLGHRHDDRWLVPLPLHHIGGLSVLFRGMLNQITVEWLPRFDAGTVAGRLDSGQITMVSLVPAMLQRILDARPARPFPDTLRVILVGGAPCPDELTERCRALGVPLARSWGMTETAAQVATERPGEYAADALPPLPFASIHAVDQRLVVTGPQAGSRPLRTGDRGVVDDGRVRVRGRADRVILRGGENVDPDGLAATLSARPGIDEAAVVGVPDPVLGHRVVVAAVGDAAAVEAAAQWARRHLPRLQRPDAWVRLNRLPRATLGKLDWNELQQQVQARLHRDIEQER